jgi:hypothetical protein
LETWGQLDQARLAAGFNFSLFSRHGAATADISWFTRFSMISLGIRSESQKKWFFFVIHVISVVKKGPVFVLLSRNILDNEAPDIRFDQCLQGFRVIKKAPTMRCTVSAFCAIMRKQRQNYEG